jgi:hypothetical protein
MGHSEANAACSARAVSWALSLASKRDVETGARHTKVDWARPMERDEKLRALSSRRRAHESMDGEHRGRKPIRNDLPPPPSLSAWPSFRISFIPPTPPSPP